MIVRYKDREYREVEQISFDFSNELGMCIHMYSNTERKDYESVCRVTTLESININSLKIYD